MRRYFLLVVCLCLASLLRAQNKLELISPNGELKVSLNLSDKIYYSIDYNGDVLLKDNTLQLTLRNQVLGQNPKLRRQKRMSVDEQLTPIVPLKYSKVNNRYNQLLLTFKDYAVEFRAFDDGVAYRFITSQKGDVEVMKSLLSTSRRIIFFTCNNREASIQLMRNLTHMFKVMRGSLKNG